MVWVGTDDQRDIVLTAVANSTQMSTPRATSLRLNSPVPLLGGQGPSVQDCPNCNQPFSCVLYWKCCDSLFTGFDFLGKFIPQISIEYATWVRCGYIPVVRIRSCSATATYVSVFTVTACIVISVS